MRLPEMGASAFDQGDIGATLATEFVTETGDELEATGAATDDDDAWLTR